MKHRQQGFVIVAVLSLLVLIGLLLATYLIVTQNNVAAGGSTANSTAGFYAAEGGLNVRAEAFRQRFKNYETPSGTSPTETNPCTASNTGSGDFGCQAFVSTDTARTVSTYVNLANAPDAPAGSPLGTPSWNQIPVGELFQNLYAEERWYDVMSRSTNKRGDVEAITRMRFKVRNVPLFQFAVFFDKDLEFTNTATLNLTGPVHANGDIYLDAGSGSSLSIAGQVTSSGGIFRGGKDGNFCTGGTVTVNDAQGNADAISCSGTRYQMTDSALEAWGGTMMQGVDEVQVPTPDAFQAQPGKLYWDQADLRIVMQVSGTTPPVGRPTFTGSGANLQVASWPAAPSVQFLVKNAANSNLYTFSTAQATACGLTATNRFKDNREQRLTSTGTANPPGSQVSRALLDVDMGLFLPCIESFKTNWNVGGGLANTDQGGLVVHFSVSGPGAKIGTGTADRAAGTTSPYGVRLKNGASLPSALKGLTVVTDQALYVQGNFNTGTWKPASFLADVVNVLSNNWDNAETCRIYRTISNVTGTYYLMPSTVANTLTSPANQTPNPVNIDMSVNDNTRPPNSIWTLTNSTTAPRYTPKDIGGVNQGGDLKSWFPIWCRTGTSTTVNAAIVGGTDITGGVEGAAGRDIGGLNGGVHNMMRFQEDWGAGGTASWNNQANPAVYTYRGSLVSLGVPVNSIGRFALEESVYAPPRRSWSFDTSFQNVANLPPLSPRFVYLRQEQFNRDFNQ